MYLAQYPCIIIQTNMTEVLFRGEYVEESHANLILARESNPNTPEYKRRLEEQAQAEEQRKKLQQQKLAESKLKEKRYKNTSINIDSNTRQTVCCQKNLLRYCGSVHVTR